MKRFSVWLGMAAACLMSAASASADDSSIAKAVIQNLQVQQQAGQLKGFEIKVKVEDGNVVLRGRVPNDAQKAIALQAARGAEGATNVVDYLEVTGAAQPIPPVPVAPAEDLTASVPQRARVVALPVSGPATAQATAPIGAGVPAPVVHAIPQPVPYLAPQAPSPPQVQAAAPQQMPAPQARPTYAAPQPRMSQAQMQQLQMQHMQMAQMQQMQQAQMQQAQMASAMGPGPGGPGPGQVQPPQYVPANQGNVYPVKYDNANLPGYAWPSYAAYPNYAAVTYPKQYSPTAWPYIGPFYPYPQVPLGWRKVSLEWDDGWWMLDFQDRPSGHAWKRR